MKRWQSNQIIKKRSSIFDYKKNINEMFKKLKNICPRTQRFCLKPKDLSQA